LAVNNERLQKSKGNEREFDIMLDYRPTNYEMNTLYLSFSDLTKCIKVARDSLYEGDDNQALLNYHEVASIFQDLQNDGKLGGCMNNIGCIYLKKEQFETAIDFFNKSIEI
jgi:tetratricopeptide (TPR) repeat protein